MHSCSGLTCNMLSVAALDEEITELDAQIEEAQSAATVLGKRARQYADLSAKLGALAEEADAQHQAELAAAAAAPAAPSESSGPPPTHVNGAEQSGASSSSVAIREATQDEALEVAGGDALYCHSYVLPHFRAKFVLKADKTTHQIIAVSPSSPFEYRGFVLWREEFSRRSRDVLLQLVCAEKDNVELVRRLIDEVVARLAVGDGELKVEVNVKDKSSLKFWNDLGFKGLDSLDQKLSKPYARAPSGSASIARGLKA